MYYGHIGCPPIISRLIYAFHMSFFFFLSVDVKFKDFVNKKLSGLIKPFILFGVGVILINYILSLLVNTNYNFIENIYYMLVQQIGTPARLWFIPCLFICFIISYIILNSQFGFFYFFLFNVLA